MRQLTIRALAATLLFSGLTSAAPPLAVHSVTAGFHYQGSCLGKCPCFDTTVRDDGAVATRSCEERGSQATRDRDFLASPAEVAAFKRVLAPLRHGPAHRGNCTRPALLQDQRFEAVVIWTDAHPTAISACDPEVDEAIEHALLAVNASYFNGWQVAPERREILRHDVLGRRHR